MWFELKAANDNGNGKQRTAIVVFDELMSFWCSFVKLQMRHKLLFFSFCCLLLSNVTFIESLTKLVVHAHSQAISLSFFCYFSLLIYSLEWVDRFECCVLVKTVCPVHFCLLSFFQVPFRCLLNFLFAFFFSCLFNQFFWGSRSCYAGIRWYFVPGFFWDWLKEAKHLARDLPIGHGLSHSFTLYFSHWRINSLQSSEPSRVPCSM